MLYYRVKPEYDQYDRFRNQKLYLIAWELYTPREIEKYGFSKRFFETVEISKAHVHKFFGARFQDGYNHNGKMKEGE